MSQKDEVTTKMQQYMKCLLWYPIILLICWLLISIERISETIFNNPLGVMNYISYPMIGLSGLLNSLLIAYTSISEDTLLISNLQRSIGFARIKHSGLIAPSIEQMNKTITTSESDR